jgi:hypothetical protein
MKPGRLRTLYIVIFIAAVFLRFIFSMYNMWSDDDHYRIVIGGISDGHFGVKDFAPHYPRLYHAFLATGMLLLDIQTEHALFFGQMVSFALGVILLIICYRFLENIQVGDTAKVLIFALVSFNPSLLRISIQATTDILVVLLSSASLLFAYSHIKTRSRLHFLAMVAFMMLAFLTKMNSLPLFAAYSLLFAVRILSDAGNRADWAKKLAAMMIFALVMSPLLMQATVSESEFLGNHILEGSSLLGYIENFEDDMYRPDHPGIMTWKQGFFSFELQSLLSYPRIYQVASEDIIHAHMSSVWTSIYGRLLFLPYSDGIFNEDPTNPRGLYFDLDGVHLLLGRSIYLLGLSIVAIFLFGLSLTVYRALSSNGKKVDDVLAVLVSIGYICLITIYSFFVRDFYAYKDFYMFPGMLAFIYVFCRGMENIRKFRWAYALSVSSIMLIVAGHIVDALFVFRHLINF